ncbi:hypothetical protein LT493_15540 [Streptomyces tricolor]|nr:hypothetical protein [Streptomyces tricolor]
MRLARTRCCTSWRPAHDRPRGRRPLPGGLPAAARRRTGHRPQPDPVRLLPAEPDGRRTLPGVSARLALPRTVIFGGEALDVSRLADWYRPPPGHRAPPGQHVRHHRDHRACHLRARWTAGRPRHGTASPIGTIPVYTGSSSAAHCGRYRPAPSASAVRRRRGPGARLSELRPGLTAARVLADPYGTPGTPACTAPGTGPADGPTAPWSTWAAPTGR